MAKGNPKVQIEFFEKLGCMLSLGEPVRSAIAFLEDDIEDEEMKGAIEKIRNRIYEGTTLHESMDEDTFSPFIRKVIAAGEISGTLEKAIEIAAKECATMVDPVVKTQIEFFELLRHMLRAGVDILDALALLEDEEEDEEIKGIIGKTKRRISEGATLHESIDEETFGRFIRKMVAIGEESGKLEEAFEAVIKWLGGQL